jgi:hypothetical protein
MWRINMVAIIGLLCAACSGGISSYDDAIEAQAGIMEEMVSVLEGVTDKASAEDASAEIEALGNRLGEIAAQVSELPQPTMEEMQEIAKKQSMQRKDFQQRAVPQMMKLVEYKSLGDAWTRAMFNMK